jgi:predicted NBD/HSP70 family sugar kinase
MAHAPDTGEARDQADGGSRPLATLGGGANQAGGRAYNERLALSLIRLNGPLPKAELARLTGLSAQTMSMMMRRLEGDGLVVAQEPVRGRIGQPSVPYALNPRGALSIGVKLGRRSTDVVICDFMGRILDRSKQTYAAPFSEQALGFVEREIARLRRRHQKESRIAGVGVAMPFELWKWAEEIDAPAGALDGWRDLDVAREIERRTGLPCFVANDASAACAAELAYHHRGSAIDLLYFFVGSFIGGGVALNGALMQGRTGNAGALGSMPVTLEGRRSQLIHYASLISLERAIAAEGGDVSVLQEPEAEWRVIGAPLERWIETAGKAIASAIVSAVSVIDFAHVCVDGALPRETLAALVAATRRAVERHDLQGLSPFEIAAGELGSDARALGAAMLPINEAFGFAQDVLLKKTAA